MAHEILHLLHKRLGNWRTRTRYVMCTYCLTGTQECVAYRLAETAACRVVCICLESWASGISSDCTRSHNLESQQSRCSLCRHTRGCQHIADQQYSACCMQKKTVLARITEGSIRSRNNISVGNMHQRQETLVCAQMLCAFLVGTLPCR